MVNYEIVRSKRKTLALYVLGDKVEVRAPLKYPKSDIEKFVSSKEEWILKRLNKNAENIEKRKNFILDYGSEITYRGRDYPIISKEGNRVGFDNAFYIPPNLTSEQIKTACVQIYRMLAKRDLTVKVLEYGKQMGVSATSVKINGATTRWGSCSSKKSINFCWRLIMAPDEVIDYVVVHELSHIKEMNHSPAFWAIVGGVFPDYKQRQKKLKDLQKRLNGEDWAE
ncbi:MAG: M48 family metallopeptidase [Oscillospiraceae bacterium]|jgi:predicted metal-dependent hydrolase|nr:M48 family metallopeptidase [Oscillospiraceae bacterium]